MYEDYLYKLEKHMDEARGDPSYSIEDIEDLKGELHHLEHEFFKTGVTSEYDL